MRFVEVARKSVRGENKMEKDLLKMNLQYFAEDPNDKGGSKDDPDNPKDPEEPNTEDEKTVSVAEMQRRIKKEQERFEDYQRELEDKFEEKLNEAEKLRKMNEEEKQKYEQEKKDKRIEELENQLNRHGLEKEATSMLAEHDIPISDEVFNVVVGGDADQTKEKVDWFVELIDGIAEKKIEDYKKGETPKSTKGAPSSASKNPFSEEHFNLTEQGRLLKDNPELYEKLKAQAK